jgi:hypothetical protein
MENDPRFSSIHQCRKFQMPLSPVESTVSTLIKLTLFFLQFLSLPTVYFFAVVEERHALVYM